MLRLVICPKIPFDFFFIALWTWTRGDLVIEIVWHTGIYCSTSITIIFWFCQLFDNSSLQSQWHVCIFVCFLYCTIAPSFIFYTHWEWYILYVSCTNMCLVKEGSYKSYIWHTNFTEIFIFVYVTFSSNMQSRLTPLFLSHWHWRIWCHFFPPFFDLFFSFIFLFAGRRVWGFKID